MVEHTVIINTFGGTHVLTCQALGINNIEMPWEINAENVKKRILESKYMNEEEAEFDLVIVDNRPKAENFNVQKERESKMFKADRNTLIDKKLKK